MTIKPWVVVALGILVLASVGAAAFALGRSAPATPPTQNVAHITTVSGDSTDAEAMSEVRAAIPAAESWYQESGSYYSMMRAFEGEYRKFVSPSVQPFILNNGRAYCLEDTAASGTPFHYIGGDPGPNAPGNAVISVGTCPQG